MTRRPFLRRLRIWLLDSEWSSDSASCPSPSTPSRTSFTLRNSVCVRPESHADAGAPQAIRNGLAEVKPAFLPGIVRLGGAGRAEHIHPLRFQHFLDAINVV